LRDKGRGIDEGQTVATDPQKRTELRGKWHGAQMSRKGGKGKVSGGSERRGRLRPLSGNGRLH